MLKYLGLGVAECRLLSGLRLSSELNSARSRPTPCPTVPRSPTPLHYNDDNQTLHF